MENTYNSKTKKAFRIRILFYSIGGIVFLLLFFKDCIRPNWNSLTSRSLSWEEKLKIEESAKKEYVSLFPAKIQPFLKLVDSDIGSLKKPFLTFSVVQHKYLLVIHKVILSKNQPIDKIITIENAIARQSPDVNYRGSDLNMIFRYSNEHDSVVNNIIMTIDNEMPEFKKNYGDSIINYRFIVNNVAFRYEQNGPVDFIFREAGKLKRGVNVCFVKRNKSVYILTCYENNISKFIDEEFIPSLMGISKEQRILQ